jgi:hypothetical protein
VTDELAEAADVGRRLERVVGLGDLFGGRDDPALDLIVQRFDRVDGLVLRRRRRGDGDESEDGNQPADLHVVSSVGGRDGLKAGCGPAQCKASCRFQRSIQRERQQSVETGRHFVATATAGIPTSSNGGPARAGRIDEWRRSNDERRARVMVRRRGGAGRLRTGPEVLPVRRASAILSGLRRHAPAGDDDDPLHDPGAMTCRIQD